MNVPSAPPSLVPTMTAQRSGQRPPEVRTRRGIEREVRRQERELAEVRALLDLATKAPPACGGRGRFHPQEDRQRLLALIEQAVSSGARLVKACALVGLSPRTLQRWRLSGPAADGRRRRRARPANSLSPVEEAHLRELLESGDYRGLSPRQLVPRLADEGQYLASESTIYRLLRRGRPHPQQPSRTPRERTSRAHQVVDRPNRVWCWDISYLKSPTRGAFFYLYLVMDVFSRRIMGWDVHPRESMWQAARFMSRAIRESGAPREGLVLHSDNGGPMRGSPLSSALRLLGVAQSFSRPRVPNDNPFSEALFRTMKQRPTYPARAFASLEHARAWVASFVAWFNGVHRHSALGFVTPDERYFGTERQVLERRRALYARALALRPQRWSGPPRDWSPRCAVWFRPGRSQGASLRDNSLDTHRSSSQSALPAPPSSSVPG